MSGAFGHLAFLDDAVEIETAILRDRGEGVIGRQPVAVGLQTGRGESEACGGNVSRARRRGGVCHGVLWWSCFTSKHQGREDGARGTPMNGGEWPCISRGHDSLTGKMGA